MSKCKKLFSTLTKDFKFPKLSYKSVRMVKVHNQYLVLTYYSTILLIVIYIAIFTVWIQKGYQEVDYAVGTTSPNAYGTAYTNVNPNDTEANWQNSTVWDAIDLMLPPESDAIFLTTVQIITRNQSRGVCDGNWYVSPCLNDTDCEENDTNFASQGILTGKCGTNSRCQVSGWCPLQQEWNTSGIIMQNLGIFTIFARVNMRFPTFKFKLNNLHNDGNNQPILGYNLFTINGILSKLVNRKVDGYRSIANKGIIILATSKWNCNLDLPKKKCKPNWEFKAIDATGDTISTGYHVRSKWYNIEGTRRTLKDYHGIRILFSVTGVGRRFSVAALFITIGSGIAYLSLASIVADIVLQNFLPESQRYTDVKNTRVNAGGSVVEVTHHKSVTNPNHRQTDVKIVYDE